MCLTFTPPYLSTTNKYYKGNEKQIEPLKSNEKKEERSTIAIFEFKADNIDGLINHCNK